MLVMAGQLERACAEGFGRYLDSCVRFHLGYGCCIFIGRAIAFAGILSAVKEEAVVVFLPGSSEHVEVIRLTIG